MNTTIESVTFDDLDSKDTTITVINVTIAMFTLVLTFMISFANLAIMWAFWKIKSLGEKPSDYLILSLACVDMLLGSIMVPLHLSPRIFGRWIFGEIGCQFAVLVALASVTNGPLLICCITLDRLLLVTLEYPHYIKFQSKHRVLLTIAICWILAIVPGTSDLCLWEYAKSVSDIGINFKLLCLSPVRYGIPNVSLVFVFLFLLLPVFLVTSLSIAFLYALRLRLARIRRLGPERSDDENMGTDGSRCTSESGQRSCPVAASETQIGLQQNRSRYLKPATTLGAIVLASAITTVPYITYVVIVGTIWPQYLSQRSAYPIIMLMYCKSICDPVMYALSESKIRRYYVTRFRELIMNGRR